MITQYEVPAIIRSEIPSLSNVNHYGRATLETFESVHDLTDYTRHSVEDHDHNIARKCFALAEKLYKEGDRVVKIMIENIFIYSFSSLMPADKTERLFIKSAIPDSLYSIYLKQVNSISC